MPKMLTTALITVALLAAISACMSLSLSTPSYIPQRDPDIDAWATNFDTVITANPTDYGLIAGQATAFNVLRTAFTAALLSATNPNTRTSVTIAAKDTARNVMVASARQLAQIARAYPAITDELLADAGLTVPDVVPSPIPAPTSQPVLALQSATPLQLTLRYKDSILSNPRARPQGVTGLLVWAKIGTGAPASVDDCKFLGMFGRSPVVVTFDSADGAKPAGFIARWVTMRGLQGPDSAVVSVTIPAQL
jgi:hypothetical protein